MARDVEYFPAPIPDTPALTAEERIDQMRREAQEEEAIRLKPRAQVGGKFTMPSGMTPEQEQKYLATLRGQEQQGLGKVDYDSLNLTQEQQEELWKIGAELGLGFNPAIGAALDVRDLGRAIAERDMSSGLLAAVGFVPGIGDIPKAAAKVSKVLGVTKKASKASKATSKVDDFARAGRRAIQAGKTVKGTDTLKDAHTVGGSAGVYGDDRDTGAPGRAVTEDTGAPDTTVSGKHKPGPKI